MEKRELVTDFNQLKQIDRIVYIGCRAVRCGKEHTAMLIKYHPAGELCDPASGADLNLPGWEMLPSPSCSIGQLCVTPKAVEAKHIYLIVDDEITQVTKHVSLKKPAKV